MPATKSETAAIKMVLDRWHKVMKDIPAIATMSGTDPFEISLVAACIILEEQLTGCKQVGISFDLAGFSKELQARLDKVEAYPMDKLIEKALENDPDTEEVLDF